MSINLNETAVQQKADFAKIFPFDEKLYSLEGDELEFMKKQTGITDEEELRKHIIAVTKEAYTVRPTRRSSPYVPKIDGLLVRSSHSRASAAMLSSRTSKYSDFELNISNRLTRHSSRAQVEAPLSAWL